MSYRQVFAVGWAIAWRMLWWSLVILGPPLLLFALLVHVYPLTTAAQDVIRGLISAVLSLFVVFPLSILEAVGDVYSGFRIAVVGHERLSYLEALQLSLVAFLIHGGILGVLYWLRVQQRLGVFIFGLLQLPFLVLMVYPAIAGAALSLRFAGFRLAIVPVPGRC